jgi:CheY-like chemotaxis protein
MVSALTIQEVARDAVSKGAAGFLLKPYEPGELMERFRELAGEP